jgi:hypothetical protein
LTDSATELLVSIGAEGLVRVSIGGVVIGLIENVRVEVGCGTNPKVKITFMSMAGIPEGPDRSRLLELLHRYQEILATNPYVEVLDLADTLPYMKAVTTVPPNPDET